MQKPSVILIIIIFLSCQRRVYEKCVHTDAEKSNISLQIISQPVNKLSLVEGKITDVDGPLGGAYIECIETFKKDTIKFPTDSNGTFSTYLKAGNYLLSFNYVGHESILHNFTVNDFKKYNFNIYLGASAGFTTYKIVTRKKLINK